MRRLKFWRPLLTGAVFLSQTAAANPGPMKGVRMAAIKTVPRNRKARALPVTTTLGLILLCIVFLNVGVGEALAEYLSPYPAYSHSVPSGGMDTAVDPLNVFFGGTAYGGYYGSGRGSKRDSAMTYRRGRRLQPIPNTYSSKATLGTRSGGLNTAIWPPRPWPVLATMCGCSRTNTPPVPVHTPR